MKHIFLILFCLSFFSFDTDTWKPGKTDSEGNLIIVELENAKNMRDRPQHETITVDMTWSILIRYDDKIKSKYYIFNNSTKKYFTTSSFNTFLSEINKIPDKTTIRDIEKCSAPFAYLLPEDHRKKINTLMKKKNCILEQKIMYCYCGAVKIKFGFD